MTFELKYKPMQLSDLVFACPTVSSRLEQYFIGKQSGHILLHGPYGSGKTSTAKLLVSSRVGVQSAAYMCLHASVLGNDIISNIHARGNVSSSIIQANQTPYVLIDEVDQLSKQSQYQLRDLADNFNVVNFVFTTNVPHAMDQGLRNRSTEFQLNSPTAVDWFPRAKQIVQAEGIPLPDNELKKLLATCPNTSARQIMFALDNAAARLKP